MSRIARRAATASLALGLAFTGTAAAVAADDAHRVAGFLGLGDVERLLADEVPAITSEVESGLAGLLSGDGGLLGGVLGGTGGILDEVLGGLGGGLDDTLGDGLGTLLGPDLSIQPVPTIGGGAFLEDPRVGGGILGGLLDIGSITGLLAGRL